MTGNVVENALSGNINYSWLRDWLLAVLGKYIPLIIGAILVFWIGLKVVKLISKITDKAMKKAKIEKSLHHFLHGLIVISLKVFLVITVASILGIATSSFIAVLGAAGLAVWLALQWSLANFAGGVLILLFKPYKIGEYIEAQGIWGTVEVINVFSTILTTPWNQMVTVPNGQLANGNITNYSRMKKRRIDIKVWVAYDADIEKARKVLLPLLEKHKHIVNNPKPQLLVENFWASSVDLILRGYLATEYYWDAYFLLHEQVKNELDKAGIEIPFPQRVIHMKKD